MGGIKNDKKTIWYYFHANGSYSFCRSISSKIKCFRPKWSNRFRSSYFTSKLWGRKRKKEDKKDDKETLGTQDYFYSIRSEKEQLNSATIQQLNEVINNENTAQEEKDLANNELIEKTMLINQEGQIEVNVKNRGFEDALCSIEGNKVRIVVRSDELTELIL